MKFLSVIIICAAAFAILGSQVAHPDVQISDGSVIGLWHLNEARGTSPYDDAAGSRDLIKTNVFRTETSSLLTYGAYYTLSDSELKYTSGSVPLATSGWAIAGWIRPQANIDVNKGYLIASVHDTSKNFAVFRYDHSAKRFFLS